MKTEAHRIEWRDGIFTYGDVYELGPTITSRVNFIPKYVPMKANTFASLVETSTNWDPMRPDPSTAVVFDNCSFLGGAEKFENPENNSAGLGHLFGGARLSDAQVGIWNQAGVEVGGGSLAEGTGRWSIYHFSSLAAPTTYLTEPNLVNMLKTTNRSSFSNYVPVGFSGIADHLLVYQARLWLSQGNKLFYTDALNPDNVRQFGQINPVTVPMLIHGMTGIGISEVDPGAQSHMFIGGESQIWILDGSPALGNAVLRRYTDELGIPDNEHSYVQTDRGLVFVGLTDRNLYLIPPGGVEGPFAIGDPVRDVLSLGSAIVIWRRPYLMVLLFNEVTPRYLYCDLRDSKPIWHGVGISTDEDFNTFTDFVTSSRFPIRDYIWLAGSNSEGVKAFKIQDPSPAVDAPLQIIGTGALHKPGYEIVLNRAHLAIKKGTVAKTFTFACSNDKGESFTQSFVVPTGAGNRIHRVAIPLTSGTGTRGDFLRFSLFCAGASVVGDIAMAGLRTWDIEYDTVERLVV